MEKLKRAVLKEEYIAITGDTLEGIILNQMVYWSERVRDFDKFIHEENERVEKYINDPEIMNHPRPQPINGWIYKKAAEIKDEIMSTDSEKTIERRFRSLVEKGFLDRKTNPIYKWDRTYQYRVNFQNIMAAMLQKGYILQDYKVDLSFITDSKRHDDGCKGQIVSLKTQIDELTRQLVALKDQGVGAIPEITSETISKTTSEGRKAVALSPVDNLHNIIREEIGDVAYKTWISNLMITSEGDIVTIKAPNAVIRGMVASKYMSMLEMRLKSFYGASKIILL